MKEIYIDSIQAFNEARGIETLHPLVSVGRVESSQPLEEECLMHFGIYVLYLKENKGCSISYGRTPYDFDEMTVTSLAPGQTVRVTPNPDVKMPKYTFLAFHPDFLKRTSLGKSMSRYEFFDYTSNEALHLSVQEIAMYRSVLGMIEQELQHAIDKHTHELIISNIELLLNYCLRFYDSQFITREEINHDVVKKFVGLLQEYVMDKAEHEGLPTVAYFADKCCLSTGYFGELVKVETGKTAKAFINEKVLGRAKELLESETMTITQVSQRLGFEYPQHFVRFFRTYTGKTPSQWRSA